MSAFSLLAALAAALAAQWWIGAGHAAGGLILAACATVSFGWAAAGLLPASGGGAAGGAPAAARWPLLAAGLALALGGTALMGPNELTRAGTALWLAGIVASGAALWDGAGPFPVASQRAATWPWLALAAAIGVGMVLRVWDLADLPAEAGCDIPLKLTIVRGILAGERPIFSPVYPGREVGFFYLTAVYGALFGADQYALKLVSALVSLATLPLLYALGARWFGRATGLWAAIWLALSPWHVTISRIGYRGVLTPCVTALTLLALDRALAGRRRRDFVLLGAAVGAGLYTYTAALAVAAAVVAVGAADVACRLRSPRAAPPVGGWLAAALVAALLALPLVRVAMAEPALVAQRAASRLSERPDYDAGERLLGNAARSLAMFNVRGDVIATQNAPGQPMLGPVSGALFLCGIAVALAHWRQRRCALTLLLLIFTQLPSALVLAFPDEVPGAVRASGALIPAALLSALPLPIAWRALRRAQVAGRAVVAAAALAATALIAWEAQATWQRYFRDYAAAQPFGNYPLTRTIAEVIDAHAATGEAVMPAYPYWIDGNAIRMQLRVMPASRYHEVDLDRFDARLAALDPRSLIVLRPDDEPRLAALRAAFPSGSLSDHRDRSSILMFRTFLPSPAGRVPG